MSGIEPLNPRLREVLESLVGAGCRELRAEVSGRVVRIIVERTPTTTAAGPLHAQHSDPRDNMPETSKAEPIDVVDLGASVHRVEATLAALVTELRTKRLKPPRKPTKAIRNRRAFINRIKPTELEVAAAAKILARRR